MLRKLILALALILGLGSLSPPSVQAGAVQAFSNNGVTTLAAPITSTTATTLTVSSSAAFPALSGGNWFVATLEHLVSGLVTAQEIVKVTAVTGSAWTVVRAQEGTVGLTWATGDTMALLPTAGGLAQFVQPTQAQSQIYNYAVDTGSANAYSVVLSPAITAHVVGMPIRFKAAHANTGSSSFNDGAGAVTIIRQDGTVLTGGEIVTDCQCEVVWDGVQFKLTQALGAVVLNPASGATQVITGNLDIVGPNAGMTLISTSSPTDAKNWYMLTGTNTWNLLAYNDAYSASSVALAITRSGDDVTTVALGGTAQTGATQAYSDNSTNLATTAYVQNVLADSPVLGSVPTAPTRGSGDNSLAIATTAFALREIGSALADSPALGGTPTAATATSGTNTTQIASTAFVTAAVAGALQGSGGANGELSISATGAPYGEYIVKWGFHTSSGSPAGLETISVTGSGGAFPHDMYFAAAFGNRNTGVGSTGVATGYVYQPSLSTTQFQAVLDLDAAGHRSGLWFAVGD
jgi:hypothetical protein